MNASSGVLLGVWVVLACIGSAGSDPSRTVAEPVEVNCDSGPNDGTLTFALEEIWRAESEDNDYLFGVIADVAVDSFGNVYLLDRQLADIKIFSPEGKYVRTIGRKGEGPGELQMPDGMTVTGDGRIGIYQDFPAKYVWMDTLGQPVEGVRPALFGHDSRSIGKLRSVIPTANGLYVSWSALRRSEDAAGTAGMQEETTLARFDSTGSPQLTYCQASWPLGHPPNIDCDYAAFNRDGWTVDQTGQLYARRACGSYEIMVFDTAGTERLVLTRKFPRRRRSAEELEACKALFGYEEGTTSRAEMTAEPLAPAITSLRIGPDGKLLVLLDQDPKDRAEGLLAVCDIFAPSGGYVRQVRFIGPEDYREDAWYWLSEDHVVVVRGVKTAYAAHAASVARTLAFSDIETDMEVICYRLLRRGQ